MALHTVYFGFSANTQGWGNMENRCAALYHIWSALAIWCDPDKDAGLDVEGLLSFEETMGDSYECSDNEEVAKYAAFSTPGIGTNEELNHESGWLNRSQYLPTKSVIQRMSNMLVDNGFMSGLTIQRLSTNTSGVTALGLKMFNEESYASNQAVKWDDLYFELTYDDQPIRALNQIRVNVTDIPDIPASGGEVDNGDITYVVEAEYTDNPGVWVEVTPETVSNILVSASTLSATVTSERTFIDTFDLTVTYGGKSATDSNNSVYQEINELTTNTRTGSTPHSSTYPDDEHYEISVNPSGKTVNYDDTTTTISVVGEYVYDNVTESYNDYKEAVDSAYTSNVSITGEWEVVSSSTPTSVRQEVRESAAVDYSENESWITGVTINGNSSTIDFTQNGFSQRSGVVRYSIEDDNTVYKDFTLTQKAEDVELESITVAIDKENVPMIPASGGEVDCDDITFYVIYTYNDSSQDIYTSTEGTWDVTPPSSLTINCTGVTGYNLEDEIKQETKRGTLYIEAVDGLLTDDDDVDIYQEANELEGHSGYTGENIDTTNGSSSYTTSQYFIDCDPDEKNAGVSSDSYDVLVSGYVKTTLHEMEWPRYYETTVYWSGYTSMYSATTTESGLTAIDDLENAQPSQRDGNTGSTKGTCVFVSVSATNDDTSWISVDAVGNDDLSGIEIDDNEDLTSRQAYVTYKLVEDASNQTIATHEISQEGVNAWIRFVENGTVVDISTLNVGPYAGDDTSIDVYSNVDWRIAVSSQDISVVPVTDDAGRTNITITLPDNIGVGNQAQVYTISAISTTYPSIYDVLTINQSALEPIFDIDVDDTIHTTGSGAGSTTASVSVVPSGLSYTLYPGNLGYSVDGRPYVGPNTFTGDIDSMTLSWGAVDYEDPSRVLFISGETSTYNLTDAWEIVQESGATTPMKNVYVRVPVVMGYKGDGSGQIPTSTDILDNFIVTINGSYSAQKDPSTIDYGNGYLIGNGGNTLGSYVQLSGLQVQNISELTGFTFGWRAELSASDYRYLPVFIKATASTPTSATWYTNYYFVGETQDETTETLLLSVYATITERNGNILIDFEGVRLGSGEDGLPVISYSTSALTDMFLSLSNPNDIPATGGTISSTSYTARGTVTVTHHWTNGTTTTEQVDHTDNITITWGSPVSAESLHVEETPQSYIGDLTATASCIYNGVTETDSDSVEVYQEANVATQTGTGSMPSTDSTPWSSGTVTISGPSDYGWYCEVYPSLKEADYQASAVTYSTSAGHFTVVEEKTIDYYHTWTTPYTSYTYTTGESDVKYGQRSSAGDVTDESDIEEKITEYEDGVEVYSYDSTVFTSEPSDWRAYYSENQNPSTRDAYIVFNNDSNSSVRDTFTLRQTGQAPSIESVTITVTPTEYVIPANGGSFDKNDITISQIEVEFSDHTTSQDQSLVTLTWSTPTGYTAQGLSGETSEQILGYISVTATSISDGSVYDVATVVVKQAANVGTEYSETWNDNYGVATRDTGRTYEYYISCTPDYNDVTSGSGGYNVTVSAVTETTITGYSATTYVEYGYPYTAYTSGHIVCGTTSSTTITGTYERYSYGVGMVRTGATASPDGDIVTGATMSQNGTSCYVGYDANSINGAARTGTTTFTHIDDSSTTTEHETRQAKGKYNGITYTFSLEASPSGPISLDASDTANFSSEYFVYAYGNQLVTSLTVTSAATWDIIGDAANYASIDSNGHLMTNNLSYNSVTGSVICSVPDTITEYNNGNALTVSSNTISITIDGQAGPTPTTRSITIRNTGSTHLDVAIFNTASPSINTTNIDGIIELEPYDGEYYFEFTVGEDDLQYTDSNGASEPCVVGNTYYVLGWNGANSWNISASQGSGSFQYGDNDILVVF